MEGSYITSNYTTNNELQACETGSKISAENNQEMDVANHTRMEIIFNKQ